MSDQEPDSEKETPVEASPAGGENLLKKYLNKRNYLIAGGILGIVLIGLTIFIFTDTSDKHASKEQGWSDEYDQDKPLPEHYGKLIVVQEGMSVKRNGTDVDLSCEECNEVEVYEGDVVKTDDTGLGYIVFEDESLLSLDSQTEIELETYRKNDDDSYKVKVKQVIGKTWSKVQKLVGKDSEYSIETSNTLASVRGTKFGCDAVPGTTTCYSDEGDILLKLKNVREELSEILLRAGKAFENDDEKMKLIESLADIEAFLVDYEPTAVAWMAFTECLDDASDLTNFELCGEELIEIIEEKIEEIEEEMEKKEEDPPPSDPPPEDPPPPPPSQIHSFGSPADEVANDIIVAENGDKYVTGWFNGVDVDFDDTPGGVDLHSTNGLADVFITKYGRDGAYHWTVTFGSTGDDMGQGVAADNSGVYVTGTCRYEVDFDPTTDEYVQDCYDLRGMFTVNYSSTGAIVWAGTAGMNTHSVNARDISLGPGGTFLYSTGYYYIGPIDFDWGTGTKILTGGGNADGYIVKSDIYGNFIDAISFTAAGVDDYPIGIDAAPFGYVYVTGQCNGAAAVDNDLFIMEFSQDLNPIDQYISLEPGLDVGNDVVVSAPDAVYVTGMREPATGYQMIYTGAFTLPGFVPIWEDQIGGSPDDEGKSIDMHDSGGMLMVGGSENGDGTLFEYQPSTGLWMDRWWYVGPDLEVINGISYDINDLFIAGAFRSPVVDFGSPSTGQELKENNGGFDAFVTYYQNMNNDN